MITLITGVPGSSKTLNTINEILTNDHYQNRPVYYYNVPEVTLEWTELTEDEAKQWFNLPQGSIVLLDECQRIFRPMKYGDRVPQYIEELETHRHLGIDIFIITQHPKLIDTKVRRLVGRHLHYKRQFGMESATRIEFQKCADDPDDYFAQKEAIKTRVRFPKKLYGVYKSADEHTHKRRIPKKLYGIAAAFVLAIGLIYSAVSSFGESPQASTDTPAGSRQSLPLSDPLGQSEKQDDLSWMEKRVPRIPDSPSSAPVYDGLTEVKTFPRPQCMLREKTNDCRCFTQQATPLDISKKQCHQIVSTGYFDPTRPDPARSGDQSSAQSEAGADGGATSPHQRNLSALKIRAEIAEKNAKHY